MPISQQTEVLLICDRYWPYQLIRYELWPLTNPSPWQIMPFRARVLRALAVPLDDLKRMVRSEAVVARNEW